MNDVDRMVQHLILSWPGLYHNRFQAITQLFTSSCYEWVDGGLKFTCGGCEPETPPTVETFLQYFRDKLAKAEEKKATSPYASELDDMWILEAKLQLHRAHMVADNLELVSTQYWYGNGMCPSSYFNGWLVGRVRQGGSQFWNVNTRPDDVKIEWQRAVLGWLREFVPAMNSLWGAFSDGKGDKYNERPMGWYPCYSEDDPRHKFFLRVQGLNEKWAWFNDEERIVSEALTKRILAELDEEQNEG